MEGMGYAVMGTSRAKGERRAIDAAKAAIASPLLDNGGIFGARGLLINITGSTSLSLHEVNEACGIIQNAADDDANIIFGAVLDESMKDEIKITVIATGFRYGVAQADPATPSASLAISQARVVSSYKSREPVVRSRPPISQATGD
jgi:cell division protein FtsZ